jgi:hypothetical protein
MLKGFGDNNLLFTQLLYMSGFCFNGYNNILGNIDTGHIRRYLPYEIKT